MNNRYSKTLRYQMKPLKFLNTAKKMVTGMVPRLLTKFKIKHYLSWRLCIQDTKLFLYLITPKATQFLQKMLYALIKWVRMWVMSNFLSVMVAPDNIRHSQPMWYSESINGTTLMGLHIQKKTQIILDERRI